jgi:Family of unknown function (DUF5372)
LRAPISMQLQATVSVCRLIPQRPACDTTFDAAPARDRCHLKASQTPRDSVLSCLARRRPSASESAPSQAFCNSTKNARTPIAATRLVRVTHPFHPLSGRQLPCVGERYNRYGTTLLLETDNGAACSVLPQWTDAVAPDPEIVLGGERALFRVADLLELAGLVDRLSGRDSSGR